MRVRLFGGQANARKGPPVMAAREPPEGRYPKIGDTGFDRNGSVGRGWNGMRQNTGPPA